MVTGSKEAAEQVRSQLSVLQRSEISNPPSHGARIVSGGVSFVPKKETDIWRRTGVTHSERPGFVRGLEGRHCCYGRADHQFAEEAGGAVGGEGYAGELEAHNGADRNVQASGTETGDELSSLMVALDSFTGLQPKQVETLCNKAHIYMTGNGRISMAGTL